MRTTIAFGFALLAAELVVSSGRGDDWPQFRGPGGSAVTSEKQLPLEWGLDKNIAWKVKLPGYAWSSPVISGDKVFVTTAESDKQQKPSGGFGGGKGGPGGGGGGGGKGGGRPPDAVYRWKVLCLNAADGKVIWERTAVERRPAISAHASNGFATETPATDGERVYAHFGATGSVFCYDLAGKLVWKADIGAHPMAMGHGTASSPAIDGGRLFIQCDNEEKSFLVALDTKTGKELWRTPRTEHTAWSSPVVWKQNGRTEVVCSGSPRARAYDPETGKEIWELGGISGQIKASAVAGPDMIYLGSGGGPGGGGMGGGGGPGGRPGGGGGPGGRPGGAEGGGGNRPLFAVKAGATGDITPKAGEKTNAGIAWRLPTAGPATPSPLLYEGRLYVLEDRNGLVACYDAATGKEVYKERISGARNFTASPWAYGGRVFCLDDAGTTHVIKAGPEFEVLGANRLGEMTWSCPAVAGGAVYIRTVDHLFCIRESTAGK